MEYSPLCFLLVLLTISKDVSPQMIVVSQNPLAVNSNVTLSLSPETPLLTGTWSRASINIIIWYPGGFTSSLVWKNRITFNQTSLALSVRSVKVGDSGPYLIQGTMVNGTEVSLDVTLSVQEPISNATLKARTTNLMELNDTAVFTCSVSAGSSLNYLWLNGSSEVTRSLVQLGNGNSTLMIPNITRYDTGPFQCNVSNDISYAIASPSIILNISYGPSDLIVTANPSMSTHMSGSDITLSCSSQSSPSATYRWIFEGRALNQGGPQLHLGNIQQNQTGNYTCLAQNSITLRVASVMTMVKIMDPISVVTITSAGKLPIQDQSFTLICNVSSPVDYVYWLKNNQTITADNRTVFSIDNRTLTISPVQRSDNSNYTCEAFNAVSNKTSDPYTVLVNFGPETPTINGWSIALTGQNLTLDCSASSMPPSYFTWFFNGSQVATGSVYELSSLTISNYGEYTCVAFNNITNMNNTASKMLTVIEPVTMTTVKVLGAHPIVNRTFPLTCEAKGTVNSVQWIRNNLLLHPDNRTVFSKDNTTLTFYPVLLSDNGEYQCVAYNQLSQEKSDNYTLLVNYGPETPVIMGPSVAAAGQSLTLDCSASSMPPSYFTWFLNGSQVATGSVYELGPLTLSHNGEYTCVAFNNITNLNNTASKMMTVMSPVTFANISDEGRPAILNESFVITCSVDGETPSIYWNKNGLSLHSNYETVISMDNTTVTFNSVQYSDGGIYTCTASNAVNNLTSPGYTLVVNFGPEEAMIHGPTEGEIGQNLTLSCSASSEPPSYFTWFFNGSKVATGSVYELSPLTTRSNGLYTCVAFNNITNKTTNASRTLIVKEGIHSVEIKANTIPINLDKLMLTCDINGTYSSISWMKNKVLLLLNNSNSNMSLYAHNNSLHFNPVTLSDNGSYQCVAKNFAGDHTSQPYQLLVNYGPLSMLINGPSTAMIGSGSTVTLTCSTDSWPTSQYQWLFNKTTHLKDGSTLAIKVQLDSTGDYTCNASNSMTHITMTKTHKFSVTGHASALPLQTSGGLMLMTMLALTLPVVTDLLLR